MTTVTRRNECANGVFWPCLIWWVLFSWTMPCRAWTISSSELSLSQSQPRPLFRLLSKHRPHPEAPLARPSTCICNTNLINDEEFESDIQTVEESSSNIVGDGILVDETFGQLYSEFLPSWLLEKCIECGWEKPTRIQQKALDAILREKKDAVVQAETGSGKTLSYLLPALAAIDPTRSAVQALIVVPTRELGLQVGRVAKRLAASSCSTNANGTQVPKKIMVMNVLQGSQNRRQRAWAWAEPPHLVIGTPRELCDMVRYAGIKRCNSVKFVVVDEVDACLLNNAGSMTSQLSSSTLHELLSKYLSPTYDDGSYSYLDVDGDIRNLGQQIQPASRPLSEHRQTIFASATIPQHRHFMKQCVQNQWTLRDPVHICLRPGELLLPRTLDHAYVVCAGSDKKVTALRRTMKKITASIRSWPHQQPEEMGSSTVNKKVLIFCEARRAVGEIADILAKDIDSSLIWKETCNPQDQVGKTAIISVLRFEDSLSQRAAAMFAFRGEDNGDQQLSSMPSMRVLIAAGDLGARGLDIPDITHVIHFDLPPNVDTYVHRAGRTGRLQRAGYVLSIITSEEEFVLERIMNKLNIPIKCIARQQLHKQKSKR